MAEKEQKNDSERRAIINGRRKCDQFCSMHDSIVASQEEIKNGFKWLIGMHVTELLALIAGMAGIIGVLLSKG